MPSATWDWRRKSPRRLADSVVASDAARVGSFDRFSVYKVIVADIMSPGSGRSRVALSTAALRPAPAIGSWPGSPRLLRTYHERRRWGDGTERAPFTRAASHTSTALQRLWHCSSLAERPHFP